MSGLFSIFNVATRGMSAQQSALNVTSHNIANANTEGYSRQRAIIETTRPFGMAGLNNAVEPGQIGTGAQISAIQRVRDSFMDYQVRVETSTQGTYNARDKYLGEIENIMNEPSDTGISSLMDGFFNSWQELSKQPQSSNARTVVAQQASSLSNELNHTYEQLKKIKSDSQTEIKDTLFSINSALNQIDELNQQVIGVKVGSNEPNDLMDKRDNLIDQLSSNLGVTIDNQNFYGEDITPVVQTDSTSALGVNDPMSNLPTKSLLVKSQNNTDVRRFSYINSITNVKDASNNPTDTYQIVYYKNADMSSASNMVTINVKLSSDPDTQAEQLKNIDESRALWANSDGTATNGDGTVQLLNGGTYNYNDLKLFNPAEGQLQGYMSVQKDIDDYIDQVNKLAKVLAFSINGLQSGITDVSGAVPAPSNPPATDYMPFFVNSDVANSTYDSSHNIPIGSLSDVLNAESSITAGNISVNQSIINNVMNIKTREHDDQFAYESDNNIDGEDNNTRAIAIADLKNTFMNIQSIGTTINSRKDFFDATKGGNTLTGTTLKSNTQGLTMSGYFKDTVDRLGIQEQEAKRMVQNQQGLLDALNQSKESISGVSLDEEMANMIQYQHAYQANAKIISTVDQLLDVVIGLKK